MKTRCLLAYPPQYRKRKIFGFVIFPFLPSQYLMSVHQYSPSVMLNNYPVLFTTSELENERYSLKIYGKSICSFWLTKSM